MNIQKSFKESMFGKLYLVPTPIGNLDDMTFRSIKTLKEVSIIASEDTRNTQKLLNHFDIETKQTSLHEHNMYEKMPYLIKLLEEGKSVAQVSDAGMPSISDPGHDLVKLAISKGISVISLPGATAGVTALIASGLSPQPFYFYGFLPRKKNEQIAELEKLRLISSTLIFYESPYRVAKTLEVMSNLFLAETQVVLCRELTKLYEEYIRGTIPEVLSYLKENNIKGECCLLVENKEEYLVDTDEYASLGTLEYVEALIEEGNLPKEAIKKVAKDRGLKKQDVYKVYHSIDG